MKVSELIRKLQRMTPDAEAVIEDGDCDQFKVNGVREGEHDTVIIDAGGQY